MAAAIYTTSTWDSWSPRPTSRRPGRAEERRTCRNQIHENPMFSSPKSGGSHDPRKDRRQRLRQPAMCRRHCPEWIACFVTRLGIVMERATVAPPARARSSLKSCASWVISPALASHVVAAASLNQESRGGTPGPQTRIKGFILSPTPDYRLCYILAVSSPWPRDLCPLSRNRDCSASARRPWDSPGA
jgi:hypothetical protein